MTPAIPTEQQIRKSLARDVYYGQVPAKVVVPPGYAGPDNINGVLIEIAADAEEAYVVPCEGGRLALDGTELAT